MRAVLALAAILVLVVFGIWRWSAREEVGASTTVPASSLKEEAARPRKTSVEGEPAPSSPSDVAHRDEQLAAESEQEERSVLDADPAGEVPSTRPKIDVTLTPEELRALALDLSLTVDERIQAAKFLRYGQKGDDDLRTGALAAAMIDMLAYADAEQRGHIWKALDDCKDPQLVEPMLQALLHDPDAETRSEAAESLGTFVGDARVRAALEEAAEIDPDPKVRKEARGSLDG